MRFASFRTSLEVTLCVSFIAFTQKPPCGGLFCPECGEGEVSAHIRRAAKLVLRGCEHLTI